MTSIKRQCTPLTPAALYYVPIIEANYYLTDGLSYDDVLLLPGYSDTLPKDCDIKTTLCDGISLIFEVNCSPGEIGEIYFVLNKI
jgi:hypothetical protein